MTHTQANLKTKPKVSRSIGIERVALVVSTQVRKGYIQHKVRLALSIQHEETT